MKQRNLPECGTLALRLDRSTLHVTLNRPDVRNAMSLQMVQELEQVLDAVQAHDSGTAPEVRALVLRGAGGHFCAGGDIKDMAAARAAGLRPGPANAASELPVSDRGMPAHGAPTTGRRDPTEGPDPAASPHAPALHPGAPRQGREDRRAAPQGREDQDPLVRINRRFGTMITRMDRAPQAVVAVLEGAVMGGGIGLACVADVAIACADASFRLPETSLGLPPAQIAPFLVRRLGLSQARRLAVTGGRFDGATALSFGLVHLCCDAEALESTLAAVLAQIDRCAPGAIATTKALMRQSERGELEQVLDEAALRFGEAARGEEGVEGMTAFLQKRSPHWSRSGR